MNKYFPQDAELMKSAEIAVKEVLKVKTGEKILIIANPQADSFEIASAIYKAALEAGGKPSLIIQEAKTQFDFADDAVVSAIKSAPDIIISISHNKLGKDKEAIASPYKIGDKDYDNTFRYLVEGIKKSRSFWSPGITADIFKRTVAIDYNRLRAECAALKDILNKTHSVIIKTSEGTDFTIPIKGRKIFCDDGDFSFAGAGGNLPAGEVFISPLVGESSGTIVFNGSIAVGSGTIVIDSPIKVTVVDGYITSIDGQSEAEALRETIAKGMENSLLMEKDGALAPGKGEIYKKNAGNIGELGIGLNPNAKITGNMLEDEKAYRTCHIAIGSNYDGDAPSLIHLDGLVKEPDITAIMEDGKSVLILKKGELNL
ncbi:MAG: aminopeptidase [Spirochaetes bacterium]|nr:aminopeptidase [Spirochaetota bacterium]